MDGKAALRIVGARGVTLVHETCSLVHVQSRLGEAILEANMAARFKAVRIKSADEFDWLIEHMTHEAYRLRDPLGFLGRDGGGAW